jgi:2-dehydro-3-deoxyphosphogluconate aldolase/(4S)-4-hydroxy-2-oxoglutarate aldolase
VSLVTPDAAAAIAELRRHSATLTDGAGRQPFVGAGTVLTEGQLADVIAAGAQFVVAPVLDRAVVESAAAAGVSVFPGVLTPSEALQAMRWGADAVKLFPATVWTPKALGDLLAALPDLQVIPTGGIGVDAAPGWITAGAVAVGMGSALTRGAPDEARRRCHDLLLALASVDVGR